MTDTIKKPLTIDEATRSATTKPDADVKAWQDAKVKAAIKSADAGKFANTEDVRRVMRKYVPNG